MLSTPFLICTSALAITTVGSGRTCRAENHDRPHLISGENLEVRSRATIVSAGPLEIEGSAMLCLRSYILWPDR